jgi:uroporphyrinogen decarboxylase
MNNTQLTSRQRLKLTLNHKEPDRIPFDLGATFTTGIHMNAYQKLRNYLALPETRPDFFCFDEQIAVVEYDLADLLGVDVRPIVPGNPQVYTFLVEDRGSFFHFTSEWGVGAKMPKDGGLYYDAYINPLKDCYNISDLAAYPWPDPTDPARYSGLAQKASSLASAGKGAVLNSICAGVMEIAAWMLGYERLFTALAQEKQFIEYLFSRITEIKMAYWERALAEVGDNVDVVQESDDLGGQNRPLISLNMYRDILKPHHRKVFDFIHAHTNAKLFLHSCGSIRPLLPELIEIGVQIINPVQVSAANMETDALKRDFGRDLVFWGGGVDTQHVLGSGLPEDVANETRRRIEDLAQGGGFVFATVHNIQSNVPPENIMAFWQTMRTFGNYK